MNRFKPATIRGAIGLVGTISWLGIAGRTVSDLGTVQTVTGAGDTPQQLVRFLVALPLWLLVPIALGSFGYLIWSAIKIDLDRSAALAKLKLANEKAWAFAGEMAAFKEDLSSQQLGVSNKVTSLSSQVASLIDKLDRYEVERETTVAETKFTAIESGKAMFKEEFEKFKSENRYKIEDLAKREIRDFQYSMRLQLLSAAKSEVQASTRSAMDSLNMMISERIRQISLLNTGSETPP